jgi:K+-sensing histidine kinase KdpD
MTVIASEPPIASTAMDGAPPRLSAWLLEAVGSAPSRFGRFIAAALIVGLASGVAEILLRVLGEPRLSAVFLGAVLLVAVTFGASAAIFAAFLAFLVFNFYLVEPRFTVEFVSAEDFLNLLIFLTVALFTGGLAGRLRDEARRSRSREATLSTLYDASRILSATESETVLRERLGAILARAVDGPAMVLAAQAESPRLEVDGDDVGRLLSSARAAHGDDVKMLGPWRARLLCAEERRIGVAVWRVPEMTHQEATEISRLTDSLVELGAAALARARLSEEQAQAEALRRTEALRTALLSSISHDLRTPLAGILASASSLLEYDDRFDAVTRRDLLCNIQEESERLNRFVANLLHMTKLDADALKPNLITVSAAEIASRAVERLERRAGRRRLTVVRLGEDLLVRADPLLLEQAVANVIENAVNYSPDETEVSVWVEQGEGEVRIDVSDQGSGLPLEEQSRIFDNFYRGGAPPSSVQGTGLGLSITKGLVEAMGGRVVARGREDGCSGLSVVITLPEAAGA